MKLGRNGISNTSDFFSINGGIGVLASSKVSVEDVVSSRVIVVGGVKYYDDRVVIKLLRCPQNYIWIKANKYVDTFLCVYVNTFLCV